MSGWFAEENLQVKAASKGILLHVKHSKRSPLVFEFKRGLSAYSCDKNVHGQNVCSSA